MTLPAAAGPWWRTDGKPFGAGLPDLVAPLEQVLNPPSVNEFGVDLQVGAAWTATGLQGGAGPATCVDWTSAASPDPVYDGSAYLTSGSWTFNGSASCSSTVRRLYCFETGLGDPLPAFPTWGRLAFATSAEGAGDLNSWPAAAGATGLAAGDAICRNLASAAGLRDSTAFKAWLSTDGTNAIGRFQHDGPWMRLDGIVIAQSRLDLTDGDLESPLNRTETGLYLGNVGIWTGTLANGTVASASCTNWSSTSGTGEIGLANSVLIGWTEGWGNDLQLRVFLPLLPAGPAAPFPRRLRERRHTGLDEQRAVGSIELAQGTADDQRQRLATASKSSVKRTGRRPK